MTNKKNEKKVAETAPKKVEWVNVLKTTYYYWRFWVKQILINGKIKKYRFIKDAVGYSGNIAVQKTEIENAKKVLAEYKIKNPDTVDMFW